MKLKGFTMAEILITLGLIGVIASLTLPALLTNVQKQQVSSALTKAMAVLETANAIAVTQHDMDTLREGCGMPAFGNMSRVSSYTVLYAENFFERYLLEKLNAVKEHPSETISYHDMAANVNLSVTADSYAYTTTSGVTYIIGNLVSTDQYSGQIVAIDINGIDKKPNTAGKDLFYTYVDLNRSGQVYPYGGKYLKNLTGGAIDDWKTYCNKTSITDVKYCAGSVIDNGGKVIYPW